MEADKSAGSEYDIKGFPTLKFFGDDKSKPIDYKGGRNYNDMLKFCLDQIQIVAATRIGKKPNQQSKGSGSQSQQKEVIVLTDSNFDQTVFNSKDSWFVEFYAPWCGHCKQLEPIWNEMPRAVSGKVKIAKVDATVEKQVSSKFGIQGYPTLKFIPAGSKSANDAIPYEQGRDLQSLKEYALQKAAASEPVQFSQLLGQNIFDDFCQEGPGACLIFFLPHIYDTSAKERNENLKMIQEIAAKNKGKPFTFMWSQGGDQLKFEESIALNSGYPAVVAISTKKKVFTTMKGAFTKSNIDTFMIGLSIGKERFQKYSILGEIKKVEKWDGKDREILKSDL